jgi:hypothetical protein
MRLKKPVFLSTFVVATTLILILIVGVNLASAKKIPIIEKYQANAISMAGGAGSSIVEMNIYSWTTEEVRQELLDDIKKATASKHNNRDVAKALRGQTKVGYAFFAGKQGYPIRYSRKAEHNGKTRIILATDRPVSFGEVYSQSQLGDFDATIVVLDVDENGKGEGVLSVGTEVKWDDTKNAIAVTNVSSQPVKLTGVRKVK